MTITTLLKGGHRMQANTVLIVDDSSVMRKIVERALRQIGLDKTTMLEASNGSEALEALRKHKVDLILSDISMPVMDGLEFLKQKAAQKLAEGVPVVMITTDAAAGGVRPAVNA
jgi:two-component system chemotaxis response regulator CheY